MSLEEAEKRMNNRGGGATIRAHSRLGALAAKGSHLVLSLASRPPLLSTCRCSCEKIAILPKAKLRGFPRP